MKLPIASLVFVIAVPAAIAQCNIAAPGQVNNPPGCNWTAATSPIGFPFVLNGTTYTEFAITDHGCLSLHNPGPTGPVPPIPPGGGQVYTPGSGGLAGFAADVICCYWSDHTIGSAGAISVDNTSGSHLTITWKDCEPYQAFTAGAFTAQLTLLPSGVITICLDSRCNNTSSTFGPVETVIGISSATAALPVSSDFSTGAIVTMDDTVYEEFIGPGPTGGNTPDPNFDLANSTLTFIPTSPGWLVLHSPLACAGTTSTGTGCSGLTLASLSSPVIGGSWDLELSGILAPAPLPGFLAFGNSTVPTPIGALFPALFGPSCTAYMDAAFGLFDIGPPNAAGVAVMNVAVPLNAALKGTELTCQGLAFDIGPSLFALSDEETGTLGF